MKTQKQSLRKILGIVLAMAMLLGALPFGQLASAEAAPQNNVLCDVDFSKASVRDLDDTFSASKDGATLDSVSDGWSKKDSEVLGSYTVNTADTSANLNAAHKGAVEMEYETFPFPGTGPALITDGNISNSGNYYVMSKLSTTQDVTKTATVSFLNNHYYDISKLQIYWRSNGQGCPVDFEIQAFNGTDWVTVASETGYTCPSGGLYSKDITPVNCNAIKIVATKLGKNGDNYTLELCEVEAYHQIKGDNLALKGIANMEIMPFLSNKGHTAAMLNDGKTGDFTSTSSGKSASVVKEATVSFYDKNRISDVVIYWRANGLGCPVDFEIQAFNGADWVTVAAETNYSCPASRKYTAQINPTVCTALKLTATKLNLSDDKGNYALQLSEIEVYGGTVKPATIGGTPDIEIASWATTLSPSLLNDGKIDYYTVSNTSSNPDVEKTAVVTFKNGAYYTLDSVGVIWCDSRGLPTAFDVDVFDGTKWVTVASETDYVYTNRIYYKSITPVIANAVRLVAKKLGKDGDNYVLELRELQAWGISANIARFGTVVEEIPSWGGNKAMINDGDLSEKVIFNVSEVAESTRTATINLRGGKLYDVNKVNIFWYGAKGCPVDFKVEAYNGNKWIKIAEEVGYTYPASGYYSVDLDNAYGTAIRLVATKLSIFDGSDYTLALNEIEVYGRELNTLKPATAKADGNQQILTLKNIEAKNFKAEITLLNYNCQNTEYSFIFGQKTMTDLTDAKKVVSNNVQGALMLNGVKQYSARYVNKDAADSIDGDIKLGAFNYGSDAITYTYSKGAIKGFSPRVDNTNMQTLNIQVYEGIIKVWYTGYENLAFTAQLDEEYQGGYISLLSTGNDEGGLKRFKLTEFDAGELKTVGKVQYSAAGKYTVVTVNNDLGEMLQKASLSGKLSYNTDTLEYGAIAFYDENGVLSGFENTVEDKDGVLTFSCKNLNKGVTVKFIFKNKNNASVLDFNNIFTVSANDFSLATATDTPTAYTVNSPTLMFDFTGNDGKSDMKLDVRDLVYAKKSIANETDDLRADSLMEIRKLLLGIGGTEYEALCASSLNKVYVDQSFTGISYGTASAPFSSLDTAFYKVNDGGTVCISGDYVLADKQNTLGFGQKSITVTGDNLDLTGASTVSVSGDLILQKLTVTAANNTVYANGNRLKIDSDVTFNGVIASLFGGSNGSKDIESTNLIIYAGNYTYVYGGSNGGTVTGDTYLELGGTVNPNINIANHAISNRAVGGSLNGTVKGNTTVKTWGGAKMSLVYGGGYGTSSKVYGKCNVYANGGYTMGYYGGSYGGTVRETNVVMTAGQTEQIFGGNWKSSLYGNTNVTVSGGTITCRIYAGCYNDTDDTDRSYHIIGNAVLNLKGNFSFTHDYILKDCYLSAASRLVNSEEENATICFENEALYNQLKGYVRNYSSSSAYDSLYIAGQKQ